MRTKDQLLYRDLDDIMEGSADETPTEVLRIIAEVLIDIRDVLSKK